MQYIAEWTRPDFYSATQLLSSSVSNPKDKIHKILNSIVRCANKTFETRIELQRLQLQVGFYVDAIFENADKGASQTGFVLCMVESHGVETIIHYGIQRCWPLTRSVMAAELKDQSYGFDHAFVAMTIIEYILVHLDVLIDQKLF